MMSSGPQKGRFPGASWFEAVKATIGVWNTYWLIRDVRRLVTGLTTVTGMAATLRSQANKTGETPDVRQQADSLARELGELARKCSEPRAHLNRRGYGPWRTPETLELSIAWYQLLHVAAHVADCDVRYGQDLRSTDPTMHVIAAPPPPPAKKRGVRVSFGAGPKGAGPKGAGPNQAGGFGQPATGTVPALTGRLARQLDRDLNEIFHKTAKAAQDIARHLPTQQQVTAFSLAAAVARIHALNEWLEEQVQRIQRQYRIGMDGQTPVK